MVPIWRLSGRLGNQMFQVAYLFSQQKKGLIPDIYVQDEKFFEDVKDEIRALYSGGITNIDQVSIHVRRGDYVGNPFYVDIVNNGYYEKAMLEFPDADFLVFSDDIEWCKKQPMFEGCEFSEGLSEIEDLNLMASCKGHIIANSSYSWWAAYISGNKTVAPKEWYTLSAPNDGEELIPSTNCPDSWIRI